MRRVLPRPHEIARAEQLGADVVGDDHLAGDHAVEQQQADVVGARALEARDVPDADAEAVDAHDELALGLLAARARQQPAEVGIGLEEPDGVGGGGFDHDLGAVDDRDPTAQGCPTRRSAKHATPHAQSANPARSTLRW